MSQSDQRGRICPLNPFRGQPTPDKRGERYYTPTARLLHQLLYEENPVTKSVLIDIIGRRIDRA